MDQAKNKTESMIIGNCLGCRGLVRIPATVDAKSTVRCPHCGESYPLQQILIEAVPELELVANESNSNSDQKVGDEKKAEKPREKFVVPVQLSKGAKRNNRRGRSRATPESGEGSRGEISRRGSSERTKRSNEKIEIPAGSVGSAKSAVASRGSSRSRRSKVTPRNKKTSVAQTSAIGETAKIVIGGLLAFPIAYLLVFWVFHQDPFNLGPAIGRVAPFAVPAKLRGPESEADSEINADSKNGQQEVLPSNSLDEEGDLDLLPIPDVDPDKIGPIEFD